MGGIMRFGLRMIGLTQRREDATAQKGMEIMGSFWARCWMLRSGYEGALGLFGIPADRPSRAYVRIPRLSLRGVWFSGIGEINCSQSSLNNTRQLKLVEWWLGLDLAFSLISGGR